MKARVPLSVLLLGSSLAAQTSFTPLAFDEPGYFSPRGVSADGTVVVGGSYVLGQGNQARRWRQGFGYDYPGPSIGATASWCTGVSADGSVVSGASGHAVFGDLEGWMRYGASVGHVGSPPGHDTSECTGVSANGLVTVGYGGLQSDANLFEAARYTEMGDWVRMGFLPGGTNSQARGANADGSVIVGWSNDAALSVSRAFRWTQATGMVSLGNLPGGTECRAEAVSADGSVVVGSDYVVDASFNSTQTAWRWRAATGMQSLGQLPGGSASVALAVSSDGNLVVGYAEAGGRYRAVLVDEHGMHDLAALLQSQNVPGTAGWELDSATCIAGDGPWTIAGEGTDPSGTYCAYVLRYEPASGGRSARTFGGTVRPPR